MSKENVEVVRGLIPPPEVDLVSLVGDEELFAQLRAVLAPSVDPEVESVAIWQGGATHTGVDGLREMWRDWLQPWTAYHVSVEELIDAGDSVVVLVQDRGRRDDTDAEVEIRAGSVWEFRGGRIVRVQFLGTQDEALEAAGLR
jgi:ketosteroid isomerase-like protein